MFKLESFHLEHSIFLLFLKKKKGKLGNLATGQTPIPHANNLMALNGGCPPVQVLSHVPQSPTCPIASSD